MKRGATLVEDILAGVEEAVKVSCEAGGEAVKVSSEAGYMI